jgi:hypothetical protein
LKIFFCVLYPRITVKYGKGKRRESGERGEKAGQKERQEKRGGRESRVKGCEGRKGKR